MADYKGNQVIESEVVKLEDTGVTYDKLVSKVETPVYTNSYIRNLEDFVQVPVENGQHTILVSKYKLGISEIKDKNIITELKAKGKDNQSVEYFSKKPYLDLLPYNDATILNYALGGFTLNLKYFVDFLRVLKSGKALDGLNQEVYPKDLLDTYNEITQWQTRPPSNEWIDMQFVKMQADESIWVRYMKINSEGNLQKITEPLLPTLENKKRKLDPLDIIVEWDDANFDLEDWLNNHNAQGLPNPNTKKGNLEFAGPTGNSGGAASFFTCETRRALTLCTSKESMRVGIRQAFLMTK